MSAETVFGKQPPRTSGKPAYNELQSRIEELEKEIERLRTARISPDQFRVLVESLNDALIVSDGKLRLTFVNRAFCEMLGYKANELIGRPAADLLDEESKAVFHKEMEKRRRGRTSRYKKTLVAKDGRRVRVTVTGTPIIDEYGRFKGGFAVVKDITENTKIIEELDRKTRRIKETDIAFRALLERWGQEKLLFEEQIISRVKLLIEPYLEKLEASGLNKSQKSYADIVRKNMTRVLSASPHRVSDKYTHFTPTEIQVANLVEQGKRSKEIASLLNLAVRTVYFHRENIRRKLGLKKKNKDLATLLLSLE